VVSLARLRDLPDSVGHPGYWAGPRNDAYELTGDVNASIFVRYLPRGVPAGSRRRTSLTVATYPFADAYGTFEAASRRPGAIDGRTSDGGLAVGAKSNPTNVHAAYPEVALQIEVYDPRPGRAFTLATAGATVPIE
jgi:hypothetical protein